MTAGNVLDTNGIILATTVDGERVYQADEAARRAIVHLLGDSQGQVSNGVETFQTSYLYGFQTSLPELILSTFRGEERRGDDVTLTVDSRLCTEIAASFAAHEKSAGKNGAAVVMNYQTGAVIAMVSLPNFDPMNITEETAADLDSPSGTVQHRAFIPPAAPSKSSPPLPPWRIFPTSAPCPFNAPAAWKWTGRLSGTMATPSTGS